MKKLFIGLIVGAMLCLSTTTAFAATAKQYVLTQAPYPIYVNGVEYRDAERPILNYQGATYVPLAKLGDLTGVQYTWNNELGRVEIVVSGIFQDNVVSINDISENGNSVVTSNGESGLLVWDGYRYRDAAGIIAEEKNIRDFVNSVPPVVVNNSILDYYTDEDDAALVMARIKGLKEPPKLSEGWIQIGLLEKMLGNVEILYEGNDLVIKSDFFVVKKQEYLRLSLPDGWRDKENGETTVNNIRIKKHNKIDYFNAEDLIKAGIIK